MMTYSPADPPPPLLDLRADALDSALRDRTFSFRLPRARHGYCGLLLTSGDAALVQDGDELALRAPTLLWTPWDDSMALRLRAGSIAAYALLGDDVLAMAVGHNAESAELTLLARHQHALPLHDRPEALAECRQALTVIARELARPERGSESLVEGHVRALLVHLWRASPSVAPGAAGAEPGSLRLLQRFRQLLEMHFRRRWSIARYADALGLSPDRLHDICRRSLGKSPRQLVQERQMHEARLMLERSAQTVDQVASALGFTDAAQFSRFFAPRAGHPPARYRRLAASRDTANAPPPVRYADWP